MPHCNDWIPLVLLLGLIPLAFWHHKDRKDDEEKKNNDRDSQIVSEVPSRFYRQDPYFVVDVPIGPVWSNGRSRSVTDISFGNPSTRNPRVSLSNSRLWQNGIEVKEEDPDSTASPKDKVTTAWAELLRSANGRPEVLRIWKPITSAARTLDDDRNWFNGLQVGLLSLTNTTQFRAGVAQIRVPALQSGTTVRQHPLPSDMITYANIPIDVPEALLETFPEDEAWGAYFNFHTVKGGDANQIQIEFAPPTSYSWNWPLQYAAFRGKDLLAVAPVPTAVFTPGATPNSRVRATLLGPDDITDWFVINIYRTPQGSSAPILVGHALYHACHTAHEPTACARWLCDVAGIFCEGPEVQGRVR